MSLAYQPQSQATPRREAFDGADAMARLGVRMSFAKDEEVYAQEEEAGYVYRVISGVVRTSRLMSDGRRQVSAFYYPGDVFGLETGPSHRFSAEALSDCEVLVVKRRTFRTADDTAQLERQLWAGANSELERAQEHLLLLGRKSACEKVASFLVEAFDRCPGECAELAMGRQDMADYLGLTIETVSRMLTQLQAQDLVEFSSCRRFQLPNRAALARLAE